MGLLRLSAGTRVSIFGIRTTRPSSRIGRLGPEEEAVQARVRQYPLSVLHSTSQLLSLPMVRPFQPLTSSKEILRRDVREQL